MTVPSLETLTCMSSLLTAPLICSDNLPDGQRVMSCSDIWRHSPALIVIVSSISMLSVLMNFALVIISIPQWQGAEAAKSYRRESTPRHRYRAARDDHGACRIHPV